MDGFVRQLEVLWLHLLFVVHFERILQVLLSQTSKYNTIEGNAVTRRVKTQTQFQMPHAQLARWQLQPRHWI